MTDATTPSELQSDREQVLVAIAFSLASMAFQGHIAAEDVTDIGEVISRIRKQDRECLPKRGVPLPDWRL